MLAVITGGSGSGKSEYAESVATSLAKRDGLPLYYIATMRPFGAEGIGEWSATGSSGPEKALRR